VALVLANGFFAGAEIAVVSLRKSRLMQLVEQRRPGAHAIQQLREQPERFLATVQIGTVLISSTAAAFAGATVASRLEPFFTLLPQGERYAHQVALAVVVALVSYLSIVLGELVPKSLALRANEAYSLLASRLLLLIAHLARPVVWFLTASSNVLLRPFGDRTTFTEARLSAEELQLLVKEAALAGSVDSMAGEIASRAIDFGSLSAADVMVPRNRIDAIACDSNPEEVRRRLLEEGHGRMPVYRKSLDEVVGYIVAKDVLAMNLQQDLIVLDDILRPPYFVPESAKAVTVLRELQRRHMRLAIVVDEHGGVSGMLTIEDLVEELVGELFSEYDEPEENLRKEADGTWMAHGDTPIREINRILGIELEEDAAWTTIAGLCIALAGRIPAKGSRLETRDGVVLEVMDATPRLVRRVRVHVPVGNGN